MSDQAFPAYLRYPVKTLELQITFHGTLDLFPEQITVSDFVWARFSINNVSGRDIGYELEE